MLERPSEGERGRKREKGAGGGDGERPENCREKIMLCSESQDVREERATDRQAEMETKKTERGRVERRGEGRQGGREAERAREGEEREGEG